MTRSAKASHVEVAMNAELLQTFGETTFLGLAHHLVCQQQNCLEAKLAGAEVEQVLQAGPKELHHHHIVVTFSPTPLYGGDAHWKGEWQINKCTHVGLIHH